MDHSNSQQDFITEITTSVKALKLAIIRAQYVASADSNRVMLMLYLGIGRFVSQKTRNGVWGTGAVDTISTQLQREMPGLRGFSGENIKKMRHFFEAWTDFLIRSPLATEFVFPCDSTSYINYSLPVTDLLDENGILANWSVRPSEDAKTLASNFFAISFSHHMEILHKTKTLEERLFYINETVVHRWSKDVLRSQLKADCYHHSGMMPSNFRTAISETKLAMKALGMFRDEYLLDFINTEELDLTNPEDIDEPAYRNGMAAFCCGDCILRMKD